MDIYSFQIHEINMQTSEMNLQEVSDGNKKKEFADVCIQSHCNESKQLTHK